MSARRGRGGRRRPRARRRRLRARLAARLAARPAERRQRLRHRAALPRPPRRRVRRLSRRARSRSGARRPRRAPWSSSPPRSSSSRSPRRCCSRPTPGRTGRTAGSAPRGGGNPYADPPADFPANPALPYMGSAWLDTTTVYGPAFTLASEPLALVAGDSRRRRGLDVQGARRRRRARGRAARRAARAPARVRDRVRRLEPAPRRPPRGRRAQRRLGRRADPGRARALGVRRDCRAPARCGRSRSPSSGCRSLFLALRALEARATGRRAAHRGFAGAAARRRGRRDGALRRRLAACDRPARRQRGARDELRDPAPARAARRARRRRARPRRRRARRRPRRGWRARRRRGRARLGLAACLVLVTTPYLAVWYLAWAVPLAAAEEDAVATVAVPRALRLPAAADDPALRPGDYRGGVEDDDAVLGADDLPARVLPETRVGGRELRAAGVVEVARPRQVDGDPARLAEDGKLKTRRRAERCAPSVFVALTGAPAGTAREHARGGALVRGDDVVRASRASSRRERAARPGAARAGCPRRATSDDERRGRAHGHEPRPPALQPRAAEHGAGDEAGDRAGGVVEVDRRLGPRAREEVQRELGQGGRGEER